MDLELRGKNAIVTGGGSNIGRSIVLTLAQEGANIAVFDVDEDTAGRVVQEARDTGAAGELSVHRTDITDQGQVEASVGAVIEKLGQVHVLVNGVGWDETSPFVGQQAEFHEKVVRINYMGPVNLMRSTVPHMVENGYGRVVSLGSDAGRAGEYHEAVYAGAKAGVIGLSKSLAKEVGRQNVTFNVVCPGLTIAEPGSAGRISMWSQEALDYWTPERRHSAARRYALKRLGTPQDVANVVVFLASDRCNFVTGQVWSVSGGYTMM
jgi:NAD(P)-dependent dehydrogenase (short-subunit alcohol dehydrogenase family)